jgi:hypothetical protein
MEWTVLNLTRFLRYLIKYCLFHNQKQLANLWFNYGIWLDKENMHLYKNKNVDIKLCAHDASLFIRGEYRCTESAKYY